MLRDETATNWDKRLKEMQHISMASGGHGLNEPLALLGLAYLSRNIGIRFDAAASAPSKLVEELAIAVEQHHGFSKQPFSQYLVSNILRIEPFAIIEWLPIAATVEADSAFREWLLYKIDDLEFPTHHVTPSSVAQLIVSLFTDETARSILDPACGTGGLLSAAARRFEENHTYLVGQESYGETWAWANLRFAIQGYRNVKLELFNILKCQDDRQREKVERFDIILTNPPFGMQAKISEMPWLQFGSELLQNNLPLRISSETAHVLAAFEKLSWSGTAAIIVPNGFLFRGGTDRRIRESLVTRGAVSAVIGLPARLFSPVTTIETSILVLQRSREEQHNSEILFIDAREQGRRQGHKMVLSDEAVDRIGSAFHERQPQHGFSNLVSREKLEIEDYSLIPALYVERPDTEKRSDQDRRSKIMELDERYTLLVDEYEALRSQLTDPQS
ncbi:N-6 DNA methylase [Hoeflea sp.]|uniref:N-6 DNA methylase n=1 Tax=Hoeflea sp. TaxID=1940281 RepID=UPI003BAFDFA6